MLYQLPNGKVIDISIDEVLNMDQERLQYYLSINAGITISNPISNIDKLNDSEQPDFSADDFYELYFPDDYEPDDQDDYLDLDDL